MPQGLLQKVYPIPWRGIIAYREHIAQNKEHFVVVEPGARRVPDGVKVLDAVLIEHLSHQRRSQSATSANTLLHMALQVVVLLL
jgi:hypothetical protein